MSMVAHVNAVTSLQIISVRKNGPLPFENFAPYIPPYPKKLFRMNYYNRLWFFET